MVHFGEGGRRPPPPEEPTETGKAMFDFKCVLHVHVTERQDNTFLELSPDAINQTAMIYACFTYCKQYVGGS